MNVFLEFSAEKKDKSLFVSVSRPINQSITLLTASEGQRRLLALSQ